MSKIKDHTLNKWEKLGFKEDDSQYYDVCYYKDLYCNYNEVNPNLSFGTLFTDGKELHFHKGGNFTNQFINKNNFMQKFVDKEIEQLEQSGLVEKVEE